LFNTSGLNVLLWQHEQTNTISQALFIKALIKAARHQWLMPLILATGEAEIWRIAD
jgi:hypothetical protein